MGKHYNFKLKFVVMVGSILATDKTNTNLIRTMLAPKLNNSLSSQMTNYSHGSLIIYVHVDVDDVFYQFSITTEFRILSSSKNKKNYSRLLIY